MYVVFQCQINQNQRFYLFFLKEKHVDEVRKVTQNEKCELEEKILQKLESACVFREQQIEKMKEKLKQHVRHYIIRLF